MNGIRKAGGDVEESESWAGGSDISESKQEAAATGIGPVLWRPD